ncbi:exported hypothetical protein [Vibrio crassostreae]|nr:exported hypothetical protein [Vibrio crassostreae]
MLTKASMLPLLLATLCFNAVSTPLTWLDRTFVENAFYNVALQHEYSQGNKPLAKWKQPIKIWIDRMRPMNPRGDVVNV